MPADLLNGQLHDIPDILAALGGLGTAAFGLVDASKAIGGGISNAGFRSVREAVQPLIADRADHRRAHPPSPVFGAADIIRTLRANWINGVPKQDQKAIAKSLIRLNITPDNAPRLAARTGVDSGGLTEVAQCICSGKPLTAQQIGVLGRVDAIVSAVLDEGYERGDQQYRDASKLAAALVAIALSIVAGGLAHVASAHGTIATYLGSSDLWFAVLIGVISTPLAPIAKDLSSSLTAAVRAIGATKR
ncbi:MAG: hypothetical protein ACREVV_19930 [Steroidobacteraceae bacterium]